jgi:hypothetical protein
MQAQIKSTLPTVDLPSNLLFAIVLAATTATKGKMLRIRAER